MIALGTLKAILKSFYIQLSAISASIDGAGWFTQLAGRFFIWKVVIESSGIDKTIYHMNEYFENLLLDLVVLNPA